MHSSDKKSHKKLTPMLQQYHKEKIRYKDHLLFFRVGDFFELFFDDAIRGSKLLDITLTKRNNVVMCGVPAHAIDAYVKRLLKQGEKVALCDQTSPAQKGNLVKREVVEKITPGTISNSEYLEKAEHNYLLAIYLVSNTYLCAWIDVSTGDFTVKHMSQSYEQLYSLVVQIQPKEILVAESQLQDKSILRLQQEQNSLCITSVQDWFFSEDEGERYLRDALKLATLKSLSFEGENKKLLLVISAIMQYIHVNNSYVMKRIHSIIIHNDQEYMQLDSDAIYNLELFYSMRERKTEHSLLHILDSTITKIGHRCLVQWLAHPLLDETYINHRHNTIAFFLEHSSLLAQIQQKLSQIHDIPRLLTRIATYKAHARNVASLLHSTKHALEIVQLLKEYDYKWIIEHDIHKAIDEEKIAQFISYVDNFLSDDPPVHFGTEYIIRKGIDATLDDLRHTYENATDILNEYVMRENRTTLQNLRLKFNKVVGYFFEISPSLRGKLPDYFILRQTLTNADRYKTIELSELESRILQAEQQRLEREQLLFRKMLDAITRIIPDIQKLVAYIAEIDVLCNFASNARNYHYTRPKMCKDNTLYIKQGRHPVIEYYAHTTQFIPNNLKLDEQAHTFAILTAPNMAGKSTFLRQNALIVLMAQIGSYVPAEYAEIGIRDKIFCRVGASDNLIKGDSTFLLEMSETAYIIKNATSKSLVIMDEIGRGTSINDGKALAQAIAEYFIDKKIFTIFATHYHSLTQLKHTNIQYLTLSISIHSEQIIFTRKLKEGIAKSSYGIEVAQLAGVDTNIIQRAKKLLMNKQDTNENNTQRETVQESQLFQTSQQNNQMESYLKQLDALKEINLHDITPLEAMTHLQTVLSVLNNTSEHTVQN